MDFQELLNIAAENKKKAQKEASQTKRYTTQLPPPKKEKRAGVDQAAIRSRLEKKQREKQQKALEEEAKKQRLLKLRAESNKKGKKSTEKPKINGRAQSDARNRDYEDEKHEQRHLSFMKKVQNVVEKTRKEEPKSVTKEAPDRPKKPKKPVAAPKGPMSYEQLLALAANQQKGGNQSESKTSKSVAPTHKEPKASQEPPAKQKGQRVPKQDDMSLKKAAAARKLGEARQQEFLKQRSSERAGSAPGGKSQRPATNGVTAQPHRTNGKVAARSDKQGSKPGAKVSQTAVSKPGTSTSKTKHFPTTNSRPQQKTPESKVNGALSRDGPKQHKQERERKRAPAALHQSRVEEYFDKAPSGNRPRPVPQQPPPPMRQSKMDQYYDRAPSGSRPQPGLQRRTPSVDAQVHRKRPASSAPPSFRAKHGRLLSEEDSDYEDDGFIDDTPLEDGGENVSHYIKEIFGYDKTKYGYESDYALRNMESSYRDIQKEEARSARLGMQEDLEDIRQERLEKRRLMAKAAAMKKRR